MKLGAFSVIVKTDGSFAALMLILLRGEAVNVTRGQARPGEDSSDGPTLVWVNLFVRSFEKIDDVRMQFSVQITFRQQWNDNR